MAMRAEYEDKFNKMKTEMKQRYTEQTAASDKAQKKEVAMLEMDLADARDKFGNSSRAYEEHIRGLNSELWSMEEKFHKEKDEADYLRRHQHSAQPSGFGFTHDESSQSDKTCGKNDGHKQGGHGKDIFQNEEEEEDDNRLKKPVIAVDELPLSPRQTEVARRNSMYPPQLRSCYPADIEFS